MCVGIGAWHISSVPILGAGMKSLNSKMEATTKALKHAMDSINEYKFVLPVQYNDVCFVLFVLFFFLFFCFVSTVFGFDLVDFF